MRNRRAELRGPGRPWPAPRAVWAGPLGTTTREDTLAVQAAFLPSWEAGGQLGRARVCLGEGSALWGLGRATPWRQIE
jgi:hypothetical protein